MLRLSGGQVESLFDLGLPVEVRELPADLAALDGLLADPALLGAGRAGVGCRRRVVMVVRRSRWTVFVRLMVVKQRSGWGYETLVREVSDSLHLRRFCRIALSERVPDESTVRKLVRRLGRRGRRGDLPRGDRRARRPASGASSRGRRGSTRPWSRPTFAIRPTSGWPPTRPGRWRARPPAAALAGPDAPRVRDRSRAIGRRLRRLNRTLAARTGQGKPTALRLTGEAGALVERSVREARRLAEHLRATRPRSRRAGQARRRPAARGAGRARRQGRPPDPSAARGREDHRPAGLHRPTPTPGRSARASCAQPTEFGYVIQLAELCENTRRGARGLIVPAASQIGSPNEPDLLPSHRPPSWTA